MPSDQILAPEDIPGNLLWNYDQEQQSEKPIMIQDLSRVDNNRNAVRRYGSQITQHLINQPRYTRTRCIRCGTGEIRSSEAFIKRRKQKRNRTATWKMLFRGEWLITIYRNQSHQTRLFPNIAMSAKKIKQNEVLQLLDDLDSLTPETGIPALTTQATASAANEGEAAEVLAFLDEITQKSTEPTRPTAVHVSRSSTPISRKSTERVRLGGGSPFNPSASSSTTSLIRSASTETGRAKEKAPEQFTQTQTAGVGSAAGWGWGSMWSTASAAIQQAKSVVDEQVKQLPKNEQARKWGEGVLEYAKTTQLDKLGMHAVCRLPALLVIHLNDQARISSVLVCPH